MEHLCRGSGSTVQVVLSAAGDMGGHSTLNTETLQMAFLAKETLQMAFTLTRSFT